MAPEISFLSVPWACISFPLVNYSVWTTRANIKWDKGGKTAKTSLFLQTNGLPVTMNILGNSDNNFPNKTVSSTYNVLPLYKTFRMLFSIFIATWVIILSLFDRGGNWGLGLRGLHKVTHILGGRTGIQIQVFLSPRSELTTTPRASVLTNSLSPLMCHETPKDIF